MEIRKESRVEVSGMPTAAQLEAINAHAKGKLTAEQAVDDVTGTPLSTAVWTFRLEEKFGWGEGPLPAPAENFSVTVLRSSGLEIYDECVWTSVQLEDTATGLRQVRTGVAKTRGFMVVG